MNRVDLILFMGQSNMAGRGDALLAPVLPLGAGYEYRAISSPGRLYPMEEPFGAGENNPNGVCEPGMKTGSLVSAFVNACYKRTGIPVVGVSCSKGGSSILEWQKNTAFDQDGAKRFLAVSAYLKEQNIKMGSVSMVWCQGCTDADNGMNSDAYYEDTKAMFLQWLGRGIEQIFLIQIGNHRDKPDLYVPIQHAQVRLAEDMESVIMVSKQFAGFASMGLMKDSYHYRQEGYNLVGDEAGEQAGNYLLEQYKKTWGSD